MQEPKAPKIICAASYRPWEGAVAQQRRATRIDVVQARSDRNIVRPFLNQLSTWQARFAKLDALLGYRERRGEPVSEITEQLQALRADVESGLAHYDKAICGRSASSTLMTTRQVFVRLIDLINVTVS